MDLEQSRLSQEKAVAGLSDREKRALAAEKRMSFQLPTSSAVLRLVILFHIQEGV